MLSRTAREVHAANVQEALQQLTHWCRVYPNLKLMPRVCELRKFMRHKHSGGKSYPIYEACKDCPGPVPIDGSSQAEIEEHTVETKSFRRERHPKVCKRCGRTPEETKFYPSRPERCVECILAVKAAKKAGDPKMHEPIVEPPAEPQADVQEAPYHCEIHGPHHGRMFGRSQSALCPECYALRFKARMQEVRGGKHAEDSNGSGEMTVPQWIADWAREQGKEKGIAAVDLIVGMLASQIPGDWLKTWLIRQATKEALR